MKNIYLLILLAVSTYSLQAQQAETVSTGAGYANQVWYSLDNDEQGSAPKTEWDLAFSAGTYSSTILTNSAIGVALWTYPNGTIAAWDDLDTTGLSTWTQMFNSEITWNIGAFDQNTTGGDLDFGWGVYNPVTHFVEADSLFVVRLANAEYKKLRLENLTVDGIFNFTYANLDGSDETTVVFTKADYEGKNFGYYSLQNDEAIDREPASVNWDLVFGQYTAFIPSAYTVAGVLHNTGVVVAEASGVDPETEEDYGDFVLSEEINTIGYDWKAFNGMEFTISDDLVFFVQQADGEVWKVVFTGFGGSATGDYEFTKEKLLANSVNDLAEEQPFLHVYPNPATDGQARCTVITRQNGAAELRVTDLHGKVVRSENVVAGQGINSLAIDLDGVGAGVYTISFITETTVTSQKLVVR